MSKRDLSDLFVYAPSQLETTLHCNVLAHWLVAYTKYSLGSTEISLILGSVGGFVFLYWILLCHRRFHHWSQAFVKAITYQATFQICFCLTGLMRLTYRSPRCWSIFIVTMSLNFQSLIFALLYFSKNATKRNTNITIERQVLNAAINVDLAITLTLNIKGQILSLLTHWSYYRLALSHHCIITTWDYNSYCHYNFTKRVVFFLTFDCSFVPCLRISIWRYIV